MALEFKIAVLGGFGTGKTALTIQFCSNHFVEYYDPTIEDSYRKRLVVDQQALLLEIVDTAGQDSNQEDGYAALRNISVKQSDALMIVYSITSRSSFNEAKQLREALRDNPVPIILVGNKCDLDDHREVSFKEGEDMVASLDMRVFFETSAKTRKNVEEAFFATVRVLQKSTTSPPSEKNRQPCCALV